MAKLRRIPLLIADAEVDYEADGTPITAPFHYDRSLAVMLRTAFGQGLTADEVMSCYEVEQELVTAMDAKAGHVLLTEAQWKTLRTRVDGWRFPRGGKHVAEFISAIRDAAVVDATA